VGLLVLMSALPSAVFRSPSKRLQSHNTASLQRRENQLHAHAYPSLRCGGSLAGYGDSRGT